MLCIGIFPLMRSHSSFRSLPISESTSDEKNLFHIREYPRVKPESKHQLMKTEFLQQDTAKFMFQRNAIAIVCSVQTLSMAILIIALALKSERTILMPLEIKKPMQFQGNTVSKEYLEELGIYFSKLLLDITPSSFPHNHEQILKYASPEIYGALKKQLMNDGAQYTKLQLSTHFYPTQITVQPKALEAEVKGLLVSYIAGTRVKESQVTIKLKFNNQGAGMFLESVSGGNPHASQ